MKYCIVCFVCIVWMPAVLADASSPTKWRILCLGDSLTAGYGVSPSQAFPAILNQLLSSQGYSVTVVNAGSSGSTSASAYERLQWHLQSKPDIVLLALGGNDGLRGIDIQSTYRNLAKTVALIQQSGGVVILGGMRLPLNYGAAYRAEFANLYKKLSQNYPLHFIPFMLKEVGGVPSLNLADGIHPNEAGHQAIASHLLPTFKRVLDQLYDKSPTP